MLFLTSVFLINNRELVSGVRVQIWDAWSFYTPAFSLVADHARNGRLLLRDPWPAGGTPDFADPRVAAASPNAIITGAIGGGNSTAFRVYWFFIWVLGPLGLLVLARHLGAPRWGAFLVALWYAFCGFYTAHAEHATVLYSFSFVPWFMQQSFSTPLTGERLSLTTRAGDGCHGEVSHAVGYAQFYSRSHDAVIRAYDDAGNLIETHEYAGDFKEP